MRAISFLGTIRVLHSTTAEVLSFEQVCGHPELPQVTDNLLADIGAFRAKLQAVDEGRAYVPFETENQADMTTEPKATSWQPEPAAKECFDGIDSPITQVYDRLYRAETAVDKFDASVVDPLLDRGQIRVLNHTVCVPLTYREPTIHNWLPLFEVLVPKLGQIADQLKTACLRAAADDHPNSDVLSELFGSFTVTVTSFQKTLRKVYIYDRAEIDHPLKLTPKFDNYERESSADWNGTIKSEQNDIGLAETETDQRSSGTADSQENGNRCSNSFESVDGRPETDGEQLD